MSLETPHKERSKVLIEEIQTVTKKVIAAASDQPTRERSLAITNLEQAESWLQREVGK